MITTESPAPSRELIEQEKREQAKALDRNRRILHEPTTRRKWRTPDEELGELCWARGIHQPPPADHDHAD